METIDLAAAVDALFALAQEHRLAAFRLLVRAGPEGLPAGAIARGIQVLPNSLSTHLAILAHAGLIRSRREGRSIIYCANFEGMRALLGYLVSDCCGGRPEICGALAELAGQPCCEAGA